MALKAKIGNKILLSWLDCPARLLRRRMRRRQTAGTNVDVSTSWTAITPDQPMTVSHRFQRVLLAIDGYEFDPKETEIKLADGRIAGFDIRVIDEFGKCYTFNGPLFGNEIGFAPKGPLPRDRKYTGIELRSDEPFRCTSITWYDYDLK